MGSGNFEDKTTYFPNLNGLRAIGALIVLIGHIEFLKASFGMQALQWFPVPGKVGVTLFFALSGFLITSLLLKELKYTDTVHLKQFYIRRVLRIWPLYYLLVFLSIVVFNQIDFLRTPGEDPSSLYQQLTPVNIIILLFLLPNFTHLSLPFADQRWSIVVEEQFYLMQPFLVKIFKKRSVLFFIFLVIIFAPEIIERLRLERYIVTNIIESIILQTKYLACIAVGCIFSILYFRRENITKPVIFSKGMQFSVIAVLLFCITMGYKNNQEEFIDYRLYSLLFAIVVVNASMNAATIFRLESFLFNFLGKISYGLYMYHPVCIGIAIFIGRFFFPNSRFFLNVLVYFLSILLSVFVSWLSFTYFESFFLKLKQRLQEMRTGKEDK